MIAMLFQEMVVPRAVLSSQVMRALDFQVFVILCVEIPLK